MCSRAELKSHWHGWKKRGGCSHGEYRHSEEEVGRKGPGRLAPKTGCFILAVSGECLPTQAGFGLEVELQKATEGQGVKCSPCGIVGVVLTAP